ncbi:MAG TPA: exodeoxyribonuclease V subunit alpha [Kofleriaceae bacterium]|nr:exodeoxyribonuclease V subunit alpha [Kofleriaceae bacterium]
MTTPLQPRGTLRTRFAPRAADTDMFRQLGIGARSCDLGDEGLYLAEELVAADAWFGGKDPITLGVMVLALMIAQRQGSTCLPLDPSAKGVLRPLVAEIVRLSHMRDDDAPHLVKAIARLTDMPRFGSVVGVGAQRLPLVVDDGCLYTERARWLEDRVAGQLARRLAAPASAAPASAAPASAAIDDVLADLARRPTAATLSDEQRHAVRLALAGKLAVITGGPGTGKTLVAATIVRGLARLGVAPIAIAAQTGKAANRITQVIAEQLAAIADPSETDRALAAAPPVAQTLHRLLGYRGERFAHHAQSPLAYGAVIVDEASMIDLELMDALLDALPARAPLILIGDAHQLPAIDAGQILADLATDDGPAAAQLAVLAKSYRMDVRDPNGRAVYEAAQAVHDGEIARLVTGRARGEPGRGRLALAVPRTPDQLGFEGVEWVELGEGKKDALVATLASAERLWTHFEGPRALRAAERVFRFVDGAVDPAQRDELERLWALLGRARVLTVTRALATGSLAINAHLHELALDRMTVTGRPELVPGEPVMITANDYHRGLFNGDQGIVVRADEGLGRHHYRAVFRVAGQLRPFAIEALRDRLELAWALTVHKSQGSELDAIALILPHEDLPLVTRELIYTGITRARSGAAIVGHRALLVAAGKRRALRCSGLPNRLRQAVRR